jgi:hypothetical protein
VIVSLILGLLPMVDNFAHLGGIFSGFFLGICVLPTTPMGKSQAKKIQGKITSAHVTTAVGGLLSVIFIVTLIVVFTKAGNVNSWCKWCGYLNCVNFIPGEDWCNVPVFPR